MKNEAHARIKINQLLTEAGWRFFDNEEGKANILLENHVKITQQEIDAWGNDYEKTKNGSLDFLTSLNSEEVLQVFEGIPQFTINRADYETGYDVLTLLADKTAIFPSKGEAKKMIAGGGVAINKEKITDATTVYQISQLINNQFLVAQKGKKNYFLINIQ